MAPMIQNPHLMHIPPDGLLTTLGLEDALVWPERDMLHHAWVEAAARATTITSERAVGVAFHGLASERLAQVRYRHAVEIHEHDGALQGYAIDPLAGAVTALSEAVAYWGRALVLLDSLHRLNHPSSASVYEPTMVHTQTLTTTLWMLQRVLRLYCSTLHLLPPLCSIGALDTKVGADTAWNAWHEEEEQR